MPGHMHQAELLSEGNLAALWQARKPGFSTIVDPNPYPPTPAALQKLLQCATAAQDWPEAAAIALLQYTDSPETAKSSFSAVLAGARKTQKASATMQPDNPVKNQNLVERDMVNFSKPFDNSSLPFNIYFFKGVEESSVQTCFSQSILACACCQMFTAISRLRNLQIETLSSIGTCCTMCTCSLHSL